MMKYKVGPILILLLIFQLKILVGFGQDSTKMDFNWIRLDEGLFFCETNAPEKSPINNSILTIVKIDPSKYEFNFLTATEYGEKLRSADEWASEFNLQLVINAGMYSLKKNNPNKGFLRNYSHFNNHTMSGYYNGMMLSHPVDSTIDLSFRIVDLTCTPWDSVKDNYHSFCQVMRMIDCDGNPMAFDKKPDQSCSMILMSTDTLGTIYIVFTRSPYTHQKMISFLKSFPFDLRQTVYLEGGPEASLYISTGDTTLLRFGSYVSKTWAKDDNDHFWKIPNVIGIRKK